MIPVHRDPKATPVNRVLKAIRATPEMLVHKDKREIQAQPAQLVQPVRLVLQTRFQSAL